MFKLSVQLHLGLLNTKRKFGSCQNKTCSPKKFLNIRFSFLLWTNHIIV